MPRRNKQTPRAITPPPGFPPLGTSGVLVDDGSPSLVNGLGGTPVIVTGYTLDRLAIVARPTGRNTPLSICIVPREFLSDEVAR